MTSRWARTAAWGAFALSGLLCIATVPFLMLAWEVPILRTEFGSKGYLILWSLVIGGVDTVVASRRGTPWSC